MNQLHQIIFQIVKTPNLLDEILKDPRILVEKHNLQQEEVWSLTAVLKNNTSLSSLLSQEQLINLSTNTQESQWVPPAGNQITAAII
jgi:MarR-like DNA-binding transcriptional regulator SgrR of sgrS sRNA